MPVYQKCAGIFLHYNSHTEILILYAKNILIFYAINEPKQAKV